MIPGIGIGILIGIITGTVALIIIRTVNKKSLRSLTNIVSLTSELLAIPTFWFGGPWLTTDVIKLFDLKNIINPYIIALAVTFSLIIAYPIARLTIQLGKELGQFQE